MVAATVALLVGIGLGAAESGSKKAKVEKQLAAAEGRATKAESQISGAQADAAGAQKKSRDDTATAQATLEKDYAARKGDLDKRQGELDKRKADLDGQAAALSSREKAVGGAEAAAKANSFKDGLFQVGRDIQPGSYHTDGGSSCYWAKLRSSDTFDISDNDNARGPQTLTIDSAYFSSKGCGTWTKIG